jgi:hypothetical protein
MRVLIIEVVFRRYGIRLFVFVPRNDDFDAFVTDLIGDYLCLTGFEEI